MNRNQRRGLFVLMVAIIGSLAVFVSVLSYVADVEARVGATKEVVSLRHDIAAQRALGHDDLAIISIPERWLSPATVAAADIDSLIGQIAQLDQSAGAIVQAGMFGPQPTLAPGEVEIAAAVNAYSATGDSVQPGDLVHVVAAYLEPDGTPQVRRIIERARVLHVGAAEASQAVAVTFALPAPAANCLTFAENFAENLRLARPGNEPEPDKPDSGGDRCPDSWNTGNHNIDTITIKSSEVDR